MKAPPLSLTCFVFLGAALLFGMEPLVGRLLLPTHGGSAHVWTTSLVVFQGLMFAAYAYAHLLAGRLGKWHLVLVLAATLALPLALPHTMGTGSPALDVALALIRGIGLPFFALASTSVVAQAWLAQRNGDPYPLYAVSNLGSLGALIAYPLLVEPLVGLTTQSTVWGLGLVAWVVCGVLAARALQPTRQTPAAARTPPPGVSAHAKTIALAAAPSALLMAVTHSLTDEVGSIPLVWALPLAVYLTSFILVFRAKPIQPAVLQRTWLHLAGLGLLTSYTGTRLLSSVSAHVLIQLAALFAVCMVGHGALARDRPPADRLTGFYLSVSAGGWVGGALAGIVAPLVFDAPHEYILSIVAMAAALVAARPSGPRAWWTASPWAVRLGTLAFFSLLAWRIPQIQPGLGDAAADATVQATSRNAYGRTRILEHPGDGAPLRVMLHGATVHGRERLRGPRRGDPLGYYHADGPLGDLLPADGPVRSVAAVGLGAGVIGAHSRSMDRLCFYELDPDNPGIARDHFSYLRRSRATVVTGDARISLAAEAGMDTYDLLVLDAFSGDSVPAHLLTREALQIWLERVGERGRIGLHISNRVYALRSVVAALARDAGVAVRFKQVASDPSIDLDASTWAAIARTDEQLADLDAAGWRGPDGLPTLRVWTDDHHAPLLALRVGNGVLGSW